MAKYILKHTGTILTLTVVRELKNLNIWVMIQKKVTHILWLSRVGFPVHGSRPKTPHSCKDTKMATPLDFLQGHVTASNLVLFNSKTCDKTCGEHVSMWAGHASSSFRWIFLWLLSIQSPYTSLLCALSVRVGQIFNASTVAFIEIWGNCPCLLTRLSFGMITMGTATFSLHLLISSSRDR